MSTNQSKLSSTRSCRLGAHLADHRLVDVRLGLERAGLHLVEVDADGLHQLAGIDMGW